MIPEEIQAFAQSVRSGAAAGARPRDAQTALRRRPPSDTSRALGEILMPALADPAAAPRIAELEKRLVAENAAARKAAADTAAAGSMAAQRDVLAAAAERVKAAQALADLPPPVDGSPRFYVIPQPFLIWPTGIALDDSETADLQSYARFRVDTDIGQTSSGYVRFYYYWTNPYPDPVFVDLAVIASWNGYYDVYLNGGLFSGDTAGASVYAELEVLPVWQPNATLGLIDSFNIFAASHTNGGFYSGYWEEHAATHSGRLLSMSQLLIPGTRTVIFTMAAFVSSYVQDDGGASVDYSTQGYLFGSPAAVVAVTGRVVSP